MRDSDGRLSVTGQHLFLSTLWLLLTVAKCSVILAVNDLFFLVDVLKDTVCACNRKLLSKAHCKSCWGYGREKKVVNDSVFLLILAKSQRAVGSLRFLSPFK